MKLETLGTNAVIVTDEIGKTLFCYDTKIAHISHNGKVLIYTDWNFSRTTAKYRSQFLNETTKETEKKIRTGEYLLIN